MNAFAPVQWVKRFHIVLMQSLTACFDHRADSKDAALAFYTLFSMTPILVLVIAVAGYFFGAEAAQGEIVDRVQGLVGPNGAQATHALLEDAHNPAPSLIATLVASLLLLLTASSAFMELKGGLDELWGIEKKSQSTFRILVRTCLLSLGMVLAFLLLVSLVISAALSWRDVWIGALFTAGLFSLGKYAIGLYLGNSGEASSFDAAGSLIALLFWVYYSAQIFFLGAEFTRQYALAFGSLRPAPLDPGGG